MKKFIPFVLIAGVVAVLWYVLKGKKIPSVAITATEAQAIIENPSQALESYAAYESRHPSSGSVLDQVESHLARGTASIPDVIRFQTELDVYNQYVGSGGTKTFEEFMIDGYSSMPQIYKQQIEAAKAAARSYEADEILKGYVFERQEDALREYITGLSGALGDELRHKVAAGETILPADTFTTKTVELSHHSMAPGTEAVIVKPEPEPFTGSSAQLDQLVAEVGRASTEYEESIDRALAEAEAKAKETGGIVAWSVKDGYTVISRDTVTSRDNGGNGGSSGSSAGSSVGGSDSFRYT